MVSLRTQREMGRLRSVTEGVALVISDVQR